MPMVQKPARRTCGNMSSKRPLPSLLSLKVAVKRLAAHIPPEPRSSAPPHPPASQLNKVVPPNSQVQPTGPEATIARLLAEVAGRDAYIESLVARNHLLRIQVHELELELKR